MADIDHIKSDVFIVKIDSLYYWYLGEPQIYGLHGPFLTEDEAKDNADRRFRAAMDRIVTRSPKWAMITTRSRRQG